MGKLVTDDIQHNCLRVSETVVLLSCSWRNIKEILQYYFFKINCQVSQHIIMLNGFIYPIKFLNQFLFILLKCIIQLCERGPNSEEISLKKIAVSYISHLKAKTENA